jgi:hypothetical protein
MPDCPKLEHDVDSLKGVARGYHKFGKAQKKPRTLIAYGALLSV